MERQRVLSQAVLSMDNIVRSRAYLKRARDVVGAVNKSGRGRAKFSRTRTPLDKILAEMHNDYTFIFAVTYPLVR